MRFEAQETAEDMPIDVEIDDSGAWETVLELVKKKGERGLYGSVEAS